MKVFKKNLEILASNCISEKDVASIKRSLNPSSYCNEYQSKAILEAVNSAEWNLNEELTKKGIDYLNKRVFKNNGDIRKCASSMLDEMNDFHFEILKNFKKFLLVGFKNISPNSYDCYVPVYRVIAKNNDFFDYTGIQFETSEIVFTGKLTK